MQKKVTIKRPNTPQQNESENGILYVKRPRPQSNFFTELAGIDPTDQIDFTDSEDPNEILNKNSKSTQTTNCNTSGSQTAKTPTSNETTSSSQPPDSQTTKPKTRKSAHDWMEPVVEELLIVGNSSCSIMRVINQFIITTGIQKKLVSQSTIRNKMTKILLSKKLIPDVKQQTVLGFDARCDLTLTLKNQLVKEEHMTFVDTSGNYLDHRTLSNKKSVTIKGHVMDILGQSDSLETIQILKTDGESANTGRTVNDVFFRHKLWCQVPPTLQIKNIIIDL